MNIPTDRYSYLFEAKREIDKHAIRLKKEHKESTSSIKKRLPAKSFVKESGIPLCLYIKKKVCLNRTIAIWHTLKYL